MNLEKLVDGVTSTQDDVVTEFEVALEKCYVYANKDSAMFPDEYRVNYEKLTKGIEEMKCAENIRAVMRLRYRYGHKFRDIGSILGITYQWVYELHKIGVSFLEKHLSV